MAPDYKGLVAKRNSEVGLVTYSVKASGCWTCRTDLETYVIIVISDPRESEKPALYFRAAHRIPASGDES